MASRIKAINEYRPRIVLGRRAEMNELVDLIAARTGLNEGDVRQVLLEMRDAIIFYHKQGRPVKLDGLGTYTPVIQLDGEFKVGHRADIEIKKQLNVPGEFNGEIENRDNIGLTGDDLVAMWNDEYPDDPVA
jgi:nucleoid DNA-binding protein